jgi:hypothetical protein
MNEIVIDALNEPFDGLTVLSFFIATVIVLFIIWPRHR